MYGWEVNKLHMEILRNMVSFFFSYHIFLCVYECYLLYSTLGDENSIQKLLLINEINCTFFFVSESPNMADIVCQNFNMYPETCNLHRST